MNAFRARRAILMTQLKQDMLGSEFPGQRAWVEIGPVHRLVMWLLLPRALYRQIDWIEAEDGPTAIFLARK